MGSLITLLGLYSGKSTKRLSLILIYDNGHLVLAELEEFGSGVSDNDGG